MQPAIQAPSIHQLPPDCERALAIYENQLKELLEREHLGEAVAIDANSGEYAVGRTHSVAARLLKAREIPAAQIVTLTIGPATPADMYLTNRMMGLL